MEVLARISAPLSTHAFEAHCSCLLAPCAIIAPGASVDGAVIHHCCSGALGQTRAPGADRLNCSTCKYSGGRTRQKSAAQELPSFSSRCAYTAPSPWADLKLGYLVGEEIRAVMSRQAYSVRGLRGLTAALMQRSEACQSGAAPAGMHGELHSRNS